MKRKQILLTVEIDVLEKDDTHADARALESKIYEMLHDRDWLNQKNRHPTVSYTISNVQASSDLKED